MKLAKTLGMQPEQIVTWFENKRVRWKTKQLVKSYEVLKKQFKTVKADNFSYFLVVLFFFFFFFLNFHQICIGIIFWDVRFTNWDNYVYNFYTMFDFGEKNRREKISLVKYVMKRIDFVDYLV